MVLDWEMSHVSCELGEVMVMAYAELARARIDATTEAFILNDRADERVEEAVCGCRKGNFCVRVLAENKQCLYRKEISG
jgi:hypothetical protein